ncbi:phage head spike fiber domain-containing protein [Deinococcus aquaticus]|uniref:phage head spike fiber domain-containing protein n=1 Tax=Deinococcus aquaticus TaxID=328692 RepID=UPI003F487A9F
MSFAAGVLTAALALPPQGLIAAYDFARVNLLNWSEDTTNATWAKQGMSITLLATPAPYPYSGAPMRLAQSAVSGRVHQDTRAAVAGQPYTGSVWLRADTPHDALLKLEVLASGNALGNREQPVSVTTAWQRFTVTMSHIAGGDTLRFLMWPTPFGGPAGEVEAFGFQLNAGGTALPYERTTDTQVLVDRSAQLQPAPPGRINFLNWTEEPGVRSAWFTNRVSTNGNRLTTDPNAAGFDYLWQSVSRAAPGQTVTVYADLVQGNTAFSDVRVLTNSGSTPIQSARIRWSDRTLVPHPDSQALGSVSLQEQGGGVLRVTITVTLPALTGATGLFVYPNGWNSGATAGMYVDLLRVQWSLGAAALPYERQYSGVTGDNSLRGANMALDSAGATANTLPPGWYFGNDAGVTAGVTGTRVGADGLTEVDITFTSSDTVNRACRVYMTPVPSSATPIAITPGEVLSWSVMVASPNTTAASINMYFFDSGRTFLGNSVSNAALTPTLTRVGGTRAVGAGSAAAFMQGVVEFTLISGATRTLTLAAPMLSRGPAQPYVRPAQHATLGAGASADNSDPTWAAQGLAFDGVDDRVIAPILPPGSRSFTLMVAALLRPGAAIPSNYADAVGWRNAPARGWVNLNVATGAAVNWEIRDGAATQVGSDVTNAGTIAQGQYAVYALSVDRVAGTARAFQNGVLTRTRALTPGLGSIDADSTLVLGTTLTGGKTPLTLAYNAVYDRALTDAEIHQAYRFIRNQLSRRGVTT